MTPDPAPDLAPAPRVGDGRSARWLARSGLLVAVLGWLWPIGAGGSMPVGGDATQFSIGLMATPAPVAPGGPMAPLERPLGVRVPRPGGEPDGGVLPAPLGVRPFIGGIGLCGHPGFPFPLGGPGRRVDGPAVRRKRVGRGPGGLRLGRFGLLPDPPAAPVGLHRRELDALGLGPGVDDRPGGRIAHAAGAGAGRRARRANPARPLPARLQHRGRRPAAGPPRGGAGPVAGVAGGPPGARGDDPAGGRAARTDAGPGAALGGDSGLRVPVGVRREPGPPDRPRRARAVPPLAALAAGGVGPVPHRPRGVPGLRRARPPLPRGPGRAGPVAVRPIRPGAGGAGAGLHGAEPRAVRAGVPRTHQAAGVLVLPGPGAVGAGLQPGAGDPGRSRGSTSPARRAGADGRSSGTRRRRPWRSARSSGGSSWRWRRAATPAGRRPSRRSTASWPPPPGPACPASGRSGG